MKPFSSRVRRATLFLLLAPLCAAPAFAQGDKDVKKTYEEKLKALSKDNWDGKIKLAKWAQENGLAAQAKTLLSEVLKAKPDNEEARKLAGYVKHGDKWILEADLEKIRAAERDKEMKEKGYVKMKNGEWVPAADVPFVERGLVKYNDLWVTKEEKEKLDKGFALVDGEWIAPEEAENVKKGLFKVAGKWVSIDEADAFHSNWETPWKLQTAHFNLVTNLDHATAETQKATVEDTYTKLFEIFKFDLKEKPTIFLITTQGDFQEFERKKNPSDHSSAWPGYISLRNPERPGVALWNKDFGPYHLRHAVAHVYVNRAVKGSKDVPQWFDEAIVSYATRYHTDALKQWSIDNIKNQGTDKYKGSLDPLKLFTEQMEISPDALEDSMKQINEAGLLGWYLIHGGNEHHKKLFADAVEASLQGKKAGIEKTMSAILAKGGEIEKELKALVK